MTTREILEAAKAAKSILSSLTQQQKTSAVVAMADELENSAEEILKENKIDLENAKGRISDVMLDRLRLTPQRITDMAASMRKVASLPDPVGKTLKETVREDGLVIKKVSVPVGVVAIIYESRPNVTSDVAAICLKSGNVSVLRGGKEAFRSANAIVCALRRGLEKEGLPKTLVNLIQDTSRDSATELMTANGYVDILIPRGGKGLIDACVKNATVPCIQTGTGICHIYVDKSADIKAALSIVNNAKTSRPSVCNAAEVCLVHKDIANEFLPRLKKLLTEQREKEGKTPVELRLCENASKIIKGKAAGEADFDTEFLDYILAVKVVNGVEDAIEHISEHSTAHSEAIIAEDIEAQSLFAQKVDSSSVYINASTRFTDGGEFGLGCEMGISTQKLHARGPMGIEELTTYKYVIEGKGHIR
ncbi:MAG: glutamate-5-semialdehyde dehydrogenase [Oscillospiraceae bacterium]|nr:glutamate-5-semialdehyde dehydrogenase [Oscillospiraceae bacterium]